MAREIKVEKLRPVADRVAIRPDEKESITKAGVYKPKEAKTSEHILSGTVVAVGPGTPDSPMNLEVGESVLFPEHVGTTISGGIILMKESQVLTVI